MKPAITISILLSLFVSTCLSAQSTPFSKKSIQQSMKAAMQWQLAHPKHALNDWTNGAFYTGITQAWKATKDKDYFNALIDMGNKINWEPGKRWFHADDIVISRSFMSVYEKNPQLAELGPTKEALDRAILYGDAHQWGNTRIENIMWWWCDALFMGPPAYVKFANITDNDIYLKVTDKWYQECYDQLYDQEEHLWARDLNYVLAEDGSGRKEENGKKIFWSRGNGWVFGGLALLLEDMPKDYPNRVFYEQIFTDMAAKLKAIQPEDGGWRSSLLYPDGHSHSESSGTGFYVFGMAWGIRNGYLDRATYLPVVRKGWLALLENQQENGMVGYVQPIGAAPSLQVNEDLWEVYGTGAFLCAGSEVMKLGME